MTIWSRRSFNAQAFLSFPPFSNSSATQALPAKEETVTKKKYIWICLLFLTELCFLLWKADKGFGNIDEAFYLTVPYRLLQGDSLVNYEWNMTQFSGWLMLPLLRLYSLLGGGSEGIILTFRYIYIAVQAAAAVMIYLLLRKHTGAAAGVLFWMLYAPFNIMALSYNSIGIIGLTMFVTLLISSEAYHSRWIPFLAGVFLSAAVLGCPFLVIVYVYYGILVLLNEKKRNWQWDISGFRKEGFLMVTAGCAFMAALLLISIFHRMPLQLLPQSLTNILSSQDHSIALTEKFADYFQKTWKRNQYAIPELAIMVLLYLIYRLDQKKGLRRPLYFAAYCVLACVYARVLMLSNIYVNYLVVPVTLLGLFTYLIESEKNRPLFYGGYIPAVLFTAAIHLGSNQNYFAISSAMSVAIIPSVIIIASFIQKQSSAELRLLGRCSVVLLFVCLLWTRTAYTFWDVSPWEFDAQVTSGPNKGIYTTTRLAAEYQLMQEATEEIRAQEGSVLYFSRKTWLYLEDSKRMASFSAWLFNGSNDFTVSKLHAYYSMHPECIPDWIFVDGECEVDADTLLDALELSGTVSYQDEHATILVDK